MQIEDHGPRQLCAQCGRLASLFTLGNNRVFHFKNEKENKKEKKFSISSPSRPLCPLILLPNVLVPVFYLHSITLAVGGCICGSFLEADRKIGRKFHKKKIQALIFRPSRATFDRTPAASTDLDKICCCPLIIIYIAVGFVARRGRL